MQRVTRVSQNSNFILLYLLFLLEKELFQLFGAIQTEIGKGTR